MQPSSRLVTDYQLSFGTFTVQSISYWLSNHNIFFIIDHPVMITVSIAELAFHMAKVKEAGAKITLKTLYGALKKRYPRAKSSSPEMDQQSLLDTLARLQSVELESTPIVEHILTEDSDCSLKDDHYSTIAFFDDCCSEMLQKSEFPLTIQSSIRSGTTNLISAAITEGLTKVSKSHGILDVMDELIKLAIGLTDSSDKSNNRTKDFIQSSIASLSVISQSQVSSPKIKESRDAFLKNLASDIVDFAAKQQIRISKLEQRLIESQTGLLKTNRAKNLAAQMLNECMQGALLPQEVINFLQGVWYDSLQLILAREGIHSDNWFRATKLTETLIWTLQFNDSNQQSSAEHPIANDAISDTDSSTEEEFDANARVSFTIKDSDEGEIEFQIQDKLAVAESADTQQPDSIADMNALEEASLESIELENKGVPGDSINVVDSQPGMAQVEDPTASKQASEINIDEQQKLFRIIENMPNELRELMISVEFLAEEKHQELAAIEAVHVSIMSGEDLPKVAHQPLPCDPDLLGREANVGKSLLSQVNNIRQGQWFVFEPADKSPQHIKLLLKLDDMQQLLFTSRTGMKVLQTSFEEFAYYLSSEFARPIPSGGHLSSHIRVSLNKIVADYLEHQESLKAARKSAKPKSEVNQTLRREGKVKPVTEAKVEQQEDSASTQMFLAAVKEKAKAPENKARRDAAEEAVDKLHIGAWIKFTGIRSKSVECKLAVILEAQQKYIFINRRGVKRGDFNKEQLIEMLTTKSCQILDSGTPYEDTLEKVVSGLRKHRSLEQHDE